MAKKQVHVYYSGQVQGVGFRFTVKDIARNLAVFGWVKNLSDGMVELVAEAKKDVLEDFLGRIKQNFERYISGVNIEWRDAPGTFSEFEIKH